MQNIIDDQNMSAMLAHMESSFHLYTLGSADSTALALMRLCALFMVLINISTLLSDPSLPHQGIQNRKNPS
jgi:hypothetical protein